MNNTEDNQKDRIKEIFLADIPGKYAEEVDNSVNYPLVSRENFVLIGRAILNKYGVESKVISESIAGDTICTGFEVTTGYEDISSFNKELVLNVDLNIDSPPDAVALELAELCKAINALHIASGGSGLTIEEWELLIHSLQPVGV